jgi:IS5 family transposase
MTPKKQPMDKFELFRSHFDQQLNPQHPLIILAKQIDWSRFDTVFAGCYSPDMGAPGKAIRLMVGLHYLKHTFNESDESLLARWVENPYWQYFCGFAHMQHDLPLHPAAMAKCLQQGKSVPVKAQDVLAVTKVLDAARKSNRHGSSFTF